MIVGMCPKCKSPVDPLTQRCFEGHSMWEVAYENKPKAVEEHKYFCHCGATAKYTDSFCPNGHLIIKAGYGLSIMRGPCFTVTNIPCGWSGRRGYVEGCDHEFWFPWERFGEKSKQSELLKQACLNIESPQPKNTINLTAEQWYGQNGQINFEIPAKE